MLLLSVVAGPHPQRPMAEQGIRLKVQVPDHASLLGMSEMQGYASRLCVTLERGRCFKPPPRLRHQDVPPPIRPRSANRAIRLGRDSHLPAYDLC